MMMLDVLDVEPCESGRVGAIALQLERRLEIARGDEVWIQLAEAAAQFTMGLCFAYVKADGEWRRVAIRHGMEQWQEWALELERRPEAIHGVICEGIPTQLGMSWAMSIPIRVGRRLAGALVLLRRHALDIEAVDGLAVLVRLGLEMVREQEDAEIIGINTTLGVWAHELRNPLAAAIAYTELLQDGIYGPMDPKQANVVQRLMVAEQHLAGLVGGILDWAKAGSGTLHYDMEPRAVTDLVRDLEALVVADAHRFTIVCKDEPGRVWCDMSRVRQILVNLIGNALKFTPKGGVVNIVCRDLGKRIGLVVEDSGPGVAVEDREAIFEPFVQRGTMGSLGAGLGLAISRRLARSMRGELRVEEAPEGGAAFVLELERAD